MLFSRKFNSALVFCVTCFLGVALFSFLFQYDNKYSASASVSQGLDTTLDLEILDNDGLLYLYKGWEFYPNALLSPKGADHSASTFPPDGRAVLKYETYIGQYQNFSYFNENGSPYGVATYRLCLESDLPEGVSKQYVLLFQENFSACSVFVDGVLVNSAGNISPYSPHIVDMAVPVNLSATTEIVVQIGNYTHYYSGITYPPILGTPQAIHKHSFIRAGFYGLLCFSTLALALFSSAVWFGYRRRENSLYLWFGLLSLSFSLRVCYPFIRAVGIPVIRPLYAIEDSAFMLGILCTIRIVLCLCRLENTSFGKISSAVATHMLLICVVFPLWILPVLPAFVPIYGQIIFWYKLLTAFLLVALGLYGTVKNLCNSYWLLAGIGIYGISLFSHGVMLNRFEPAYTGWPDEYGTFLLVLCFGIMMVVRSLHLVRENQRLNAHLQDEVDKKTKRLTALLEERRQFLAGAAHDLKAPMTSLQLFAQAVEANSVELDSDTLKSIQVIRRKSDEMQNRLLEIQAFAVDDAKPRNATLIDLEKIVSDFYKLNFPDISVSGVHFSMDTDATPCMIVGDKVQLERILQNLVYNALSFTDEDGCISMELKRKKDFAVLKISDTGIGISPSDIPYLFDRFFSSRENGNNYGLGLYLVKVFVKENDGEISVQSKLGEGTTFTMVFPVAPKSLSCSSR